MNILPKKRWHVRTKDNIARVRKDEAAAREEERKKQEKLKLAESEARINFLRKSSGLPEKQHDEERREIHPFKDSGSSTSKHVDLFADYKSHVKATNKDLEREKKEEQEKYEKKIGYLTYLGQDTNEALRLKSWYEKAPRRLDYGFKRNEITETDIKTKNDHDPLTLIKSLLPDDSKLNTKPSQKRKRSPSPQVSEHKAGLSKSTKRAKKEHKRGRHKKRSKEHKKDKRNNEDHTQRLEKLEKLRKERIRRETAERARQDALLAPNEPKKSESISNPVTRIVQKYNSQFNPELAKQNLN